MLQAGSQKIIEGCSKEMYLPYLASSQIWQNSFVDHCHFGYITKLYQNWLIELVPKLSREK
jgi:hypothetical protein